MKTINRRVLKVLLLLGVLVASCATSKFDADANETANSVSKPPTDVIPSPAGAENPPAMRDPSLVSISAGALVVKSPDEYGEVWSAIMILDENPKSGWATSKGVTSPQTIVIELPERTILTEVEFDTAAADGPGRAAREVAVEISDASATNGFQNIADVSLRDAVDNQRFPVSSETAGRWVRLTIKNNHGSTEYIELFDFRATGKQLTSTPLANVSGTYSTNYGDFHLKHEGTSINGCYEFKDGVVEGGIESRVIKFTWIQSNARGPAVMVFTSDRSQMYGLWWYEGDPQPKGVWNGKKKSNEVGKCGGSAIGAEKQMTDSIEKTGRARINGINFATDSDVINDESKPTLDKMASMLKSNAAWRITIEGHTDSTSTAAYNQKLSERRAASVKAYLVLAGIKAERLETVGYGASRPVGPNETALGRAQNRRVELLKQ
jgi:outer membrane protein OmpA-like peptidoglycan-associated protein